MTPAHHAHETQGQLARGNPQGFADLRVFAECFEDAERAEMAVSNRIGSGQVPEEIAVAILAAAKHTKSTVDKAMVKCFKRVAPELYEWATNTVGVGEHTLARLLGVIGHPVYAYPHHWEGTGTDRVLVADEPFERNLAKLWAYCGHGDPSRKRRKGMTADEATSLGNPRAKKITWLLAMSCMRQAGSEPQTIAEPQTDPGFTALSAVDAIRCAQSTKYPVDGNSSEDAMSSTQPIVRPRPRSPYRDVFDLAKVTYAGRDDMTPGHRNAAALRITGKEILRDLWLTAKETG